MLHCSYQWNVYSLERIHIYIYIYIYIYTYIYTYIYIYIRHAYRPEKIGTLSENLRLKLKVFFHSVLSFPVPNFKDHYNLSRQKASMPSLNIFFFLHLKKKNNDKETDVIAAKVAMVDLEVELNLPLSTLDRINKVFEKSLRIQTLLKGQLKMFLFLVLSSSFLCLLFFFSVIRGRHVWYIYIK